MNICTKCKAELPDPVLECPICGGRVLCLTPPSDAEPRIITKEELEAVQEQQRQGGLGFNLTRLGYIEESELTAFLSRQYGVPSIDLSEFEIDAEIIAIVPREVAEKHQVIPVNQAGASLIVAMADPSNIFAIDELRASTGHHIEVVVASAEAIRESIGRYYGPKGR